MKYTIRYAYYDLGQQEEGNTVVVQLRGSPANVILVDPQNLARYRAGQTFDCVGGRQKRSPARLSIPRDGHWYVVLDLGGFGGRARGAVKVVRPDGSEVALGDAPVEEEEKSAAAS